MATTGAAACLVSVAHAADADLAKQLNNPVASLISVPFQFNYDRDFGAEDGHRLLLNFQPVIPFGLSANWNLISRTIVPLVRQDDIAGSSGSQSGPGDITQSLFLSPVKPGPAGIIWGVGPAFLIPTATDDLLGGEKWGVGPTGVALRQSGHWTVGMLANHIWSVAGKSDRADVSATFLQPFLAYTTDDAQTYSVNSESTYDWENERWSVPINLVASKLVEINKQPVSFAGGLRYWVQAPDSGPEDFGLRFAVTLLFPK